MMDTGLVVSNTAALAHRSPHCYGEKSHGWQQLNVKAA